MTISPAFEPPISTVKVTLWVTGSYVYDKDTDSRLQRANVISAKSRRDLNIVYITRKRFV
jgi:hypothetical protein